VQKGVFLVFPARFYALFLTVLSRKSLIRALRPPLSLTRFTVGLSLLRPWNPESSPVSLLGHDWEQGRLVLTFRSIMAESGESGTYGGLSNSEEGRGEEGEDTLHMPSLYPRRHTIPPYPA